MNVIKSVMLIWLNIVSQILLKSLSHQNMWSDLCILAYFGPKEDRFCNILVRTRQIGLETFALLKIIPYGAEVFHCSAISKKKL